jgi:glycosyltransferase involved in cell wall biosynthesis
MRILTFLHSFEPGGVERVALRLVRQWREVGVDTPLFVGRDDGAMRAGLGEELERHVPRQPAFSVARFETLWMILTLPATIRRLRPDLLFCAGNSYTVVAVAMKLRLGRACPSIVAKISNDLERRDMGWPMRMAYRFWLRLQGRFIDHFVAMAPGLEREVAAYIRPGDAAITVIPNPALSLAQIDRLRSVERPVRRAADGRLFVGIGRLVRQKNFALMIEAFAQAGGPHDRLLILGEGPDRAALGALADRLGVASRVTLAGYVPDPASCLGHADIFLLSSDYEGVPAVLLEALAVGLPVIATESSRAIRPLLDDGALGRIVPAGDRHAFAAAMADAAHLTQDAQASLAQASLAQASRFALETASLAYLRTFAAVVAQPMGGDITPVSMAETGLTPHFPIPSTMTSSL